MALFPKIHSPCPYQGAQLSEILDGDMCRLCKRQVFDLSGMDDADRVAFFSNCAAEDVCVTYKIRPALVGAVLAAAAVVAPTAASACDVSETVVITGGGIRPAHVQFVRDDHAPALPVVYESAPPRDTAAKPAAPAPKIPAAP